tara:strand:- start:478 stop:1185 length:708 start_codon:yes stop_codon:yes gene_type:complete
MIVSINQPAFIPWLGYFDRIQLSDVHIVLDHVQFEKNSVVNRNKIKTEGSWGWLTVPVQTKGLFGNLAINSVRIDNSTNWPKKHMNALRVNYSKSPFYSEHASFFEQVYSKEWPLLYPLIEEITNYFLSVFEITTKLICSSELTTKSKGSDQIVELCKEVGGTTYISGPFGRDYLKQSAFECEGIELLFHEYKHPEYTQTSCGFEPYMSAMDLLFNVGPDSLGILKSKQNSSYTR